MAAGATHTDTVTYARAFAYDEVTKTATATGGWQVISGTADFLAVYSPLAAGYHLQDSNQSIISEETIGSDADAKNETIDVIYEPNTDTPATITFFDDTTGQALAEETSLTSRGTTGEQASVTIDHKRYVQRFCNALGNWNPLGGYRHNSIHRFVQILGSDNATDLS